jgi:hypothetical protein
MANDDYVIPFIDCSQYCKTLVFQSKASKYLQNEKLPYEMNLIRRVSCQVFLHNGNYQLERFAHRDSIFREEILDLDFYNNQTIKRANPETENIKGLQNSHGKGLGIWIYTDLTLLLEEINRFEDYIIEFNKLF